MNGAACHPLPPATSPREAVREVVLKRWGVRRVAAWCDVAEATVYQWLSRGTDAEPIPPSQIPAIVAGAKGEGFAAEISLLWPALAEALATEPAP